MLERNGSGPFLPFTNRSRCCSCSPHCSHSLQKRNQVGSELVAGFGLFTKVDYRANTLLR